MPNPLEPSGPNKLVNVGAPSHAAISKTPLNTLANEIGDALQIDPTVFENQAETLAGASFEHRGPVWVVTLDDAQTEALDQLLAEGNDWLRRLAGPMAAPINTALSSAIDYIQFINELGGHHGVDINGVLGTNGVIVTPRLGPLYEDLAEAARLGVSGRTIMDFIVRASARLPVLASTLEIPVVAAVFQAVASGTPLGWAIAAGVGLIVNLFEAEPDPNLHGAVMADRSQAQAWESFWLGQLGEDRQVALLSWQGFFSAQQGGGHGVYANRPEVGPWETWTLIDNGDGTVSLRTINGHYLTAEQGGGRECQADRTRIGDWEKFELVNLPDGRVALRTHIGKQFVSVQRDS